MFAARSAQGLQMTDHALDVGVRGMTEHAAGQDKVAGEHALGSCFEHASPMTVTVPCWRPGRTSWASCVATLLRRPTTRRTVPARSGSTKRAFEALTDFVDQP